MPLGEVVPWQLRKQLQNFFVNDLQEACVFCVRSEASKRFKIKLVRKAKFMNLKQMVRARTLETYIEASKTSEGLPG